MGTTVSPGGPGPGGFSPDGFDPTTVGGSLFTARRYPPDYPGLAGKTLNPGKTIEELQAAEPGREQAQ